MKKIIYLTLVVFYSCSVFAQNSYTHSGKIIGSYSIGNKEVTSIYDEATGCVRKSTPHSKGIFIPNEVVQLVFNEKKQMADVIKPLLLENVHADKKCEENEGQVTNLRPLTYSDISDFYGNQHNAVLEYSIGEKPVHNVNQFIARFNDFYKKTDFKLTNEVLQIFDVEKWIKTKSTLLAKIKVVEDEFLSSNTILMIEKNIYKEIFNILRDFIEDGDDKKFYDSMNLCRLKCLEGRFSNELTDCNQDMVKPLAIIGVSIKTTEYWLEKLDAGIINISESTDKPAGIAPWVVADAVGAGLGALGSALSAIDGDVSWGSFGASVVFGALGGSGASFLRW